MKRLLAHKKKILFYSLLVVLISLFFFFLGSKLETEKIAGWVEQTGPWAPIVFIALMLVSYVIPPISGTPVFWAGFLLFNSKSQLYNYLAYLLGAVINFWIARLWGRDLVVKLVGKKSISQVDKLAQHYGKNILLLLRVFQGQFHDFISYAYGLTQMKFSVYFLISVLGPIPWLALWQFYLFKRINNLADYTFWWVVTMVPLWIATFIFLEKFRQIKKKKS